MRQTCIEPPVQGWLPSHGFHRSGAKSSCHGERLEPFATCCLATVDLRSIEARSARACLVGKASSFARRFWSTLGRFTSDVERVPAGLLQTVD